MGRVGAEEEVVRVSVVAGVIVGVGGGVRGGKREAGRAGAESVDGGAVLFEVVVGIVRVCVCWSAGVGSGEWGLGASGAGAGESAFLRLGRAADDVAGEAGVREQRRFPGLGGIVFGTAEAGAEFEGQPG